MSESVNYAVTDGVAHIRLNRPDAANALNLPAAQQLRAAAVRAGEDDDVRAVLVTGAGSRFCAGGDVGSFVEADDQAAYLHELATDAATTAIAALEKPVVAAVHGAVAGAGLALMLSCDVVVAASGTKFVFAYPSIGLTPDCGLSYLLPRAIGQQRALTFALSGKPVDAARALEWGLVSEVAENAEAAITRGREVVAGFATGPHRALGQVRRLLRAGWEMDRAATGAEEARTISDMVTGAEAQVLISEFINR
ncbi:enoyl-CoA hydratase/isomerase family protein [Saccharomonospora viridis]|uniref:Enoyl-CoA hydratase n=1 Tax=Saccharomonospora viridis (strain ATCC 15386 / DSM 43017 / JCM 3036 / CCUG 5913 / NBRC 12207 / NCIMB 9602 / P101) TaxID=471857 RepID=C7MTU1_SACVD|nr:enoyl-CoA hydratase/isomerase family protein [Saccharomonospora viridis]ACU96824.1 Enoyl-CoA hydratase [Saccharomonospora viridis DSM 43017]